MATVTSKGQVTLPRKIREALGLVPGSQIDFVVGPEGVLLRKRIQPQAIERWFGALQNNLPQGATSTDQLMELLRGRPDLEGEPDR